MEEKYTPVLTLEPELKPEGKAAPASGLPVKEAEAALRESANLTPEEMEQVRSFSEQIDITDSTQVMQYGAACQQKMSEFSESALQNVRTKDLGEAGDMIVELISELKGFNAADEEKGFFAFLRKKSSQLEALKARYDKAEVNVDRISGMLEAHQITLMKDVSLLDNMYERNLAYFKELTMYIIAGKQKLEHERSVVLPELTAKAEKSGLPEDAQRARDHADMCTRFEKKLYDLELTRNISIQMAPQIRFIQNNDTQMAEKIQTTLVNTIPLWKSQMVLALGIAHSKQAAEAQSAVTNMTNELLKKNAEALKTATVEVAKESERGIVDIETLNETNNKLIETMDEVLRIQREGHEARVAAEAELVNIETRLRQKLVEVTSVAGDKSRQ